MAPKLTLQDAQVIMQACVFKAQEINADTNIAITDDSRNLVMFQRLDHGRVARIDISKGKSFTASAARLQITV